MEGNYLVLSSYLEVCNFYYQVVDLVLCISGGVLSAFMTLFFLTKQIQIFIALLSGKAVYNPPNQQVKFTYLRLHNWLMAELLQNTKFVNSLRRNFINYIVLAILCVFSPTCSVDRSE